MTTITVRVSPLRGNPQRVRGGVGACLGGASRADPVAARDSVAHDLVEDERVERIRGAPARARAAFEDGDVFLVDLCILAIPRIEVRLDLSDLEVDSK